MKKRILFYSHDTMGLGHIRRTQKIANQLAGPDTAILIICSSPKANDFSSAGGVDYLKLPGFAKLQTGDYIPRNLNLELQDFVTIRSEIILSTVKSFRPDVFIADKEPLGVKKELLASLQYLSSELPNCYKACGLRDILDSSEKIEKEWTKRNSYQSLKELYDGIFVYGDKKVYDLGKEYNLDQELCRKMHYMGYLFKDQDSASEPFPEFLRFQDEEENDLPLVVFTLGGGEDGEEFLDVYSKALQEKRHLGKFRSILVTGPFLSHKKYTEIEKRMLGIDGVRMFRFLSQMPVLMERADLIISMGGYNTFCEVLSMGKRPLILPRVKPRLEQLIRADIFKELGFCDYIHPDKLSPDSIIDKINEMMGTRRPEQVNFLCDGLAETAMFIRKQLQA